MLPDADHVPAALARARFAFRRSRRVVAPSSRATTHGWPWEDCRALGTRAKSSHPHRSRRAPVRTLHRQLSGPRSRAVGEPGTASHACAMPSVEAARRCVTGSGRRHRRRCRRRGRRGRPRQRWLRRCLSSSAVSSGSAFERRRRSLSRSSGSWPRTSSTTLSIAGQSRLMLIASLSATTERRQAPRFGHRAGRGSAPGQLQPLPMRSTQAVPELLGYRDAHLCNVDCEAILSVNRKIDRERASFACSSSVLRRLQPPAWIRRSRL